MLTHAFFPGMKERETSLIALRERIRRSHRERVLALAPDSQQGTGVGVVGDVLTRLAKIVEARPRAPATLSPHAGLWARRPEGGRGLWPPFFSQLCFSEMVLSISSGLWKLAALRKLHELGDTNRKQKHSRPVASAVAWRDHF